MQVLQPSSSAGTALAAHVCRSAACLAHRAPPWRSVRFQPPIVPHTDSDCAVWLVHQLSSTAVAIIATRRTRQCAGLWLRRSWQQHPLRVKARLVLQVCGVTRGRAAGPGARRSADQLCQGCGAPDAGAEVCAAGGCEPPPPSALPLSCPVSTDLAAVSSWRESASTCTRPLHVL